MKNNGEVITERDCANIILQVLNVLNYMHSINVWHCDLKLENIMVKLERNGDKTNIICKVTDFGFSQKIDPDQKSTKYIGTPVYMAPELMNNLPYDSKVDIWALGVITYMILASELPF